METKLQALIAEQKALTARFEELLHSTTELHLPEKVSEVADTDAGNIEDIKVGDWIWVNEIGQYSENEVTLILSTNPHQVKDTDSGDYMFEINANQYYIGTSKADKFYKVDPPVVLIQGEVYENKEGCVWIHNCLNQSDSSSISICGLDNKGGLHINGWFSLIGLKKSAKIDLLFDTIKDNSKHFDKENMRLLDVEEWSCDKGLPIMVRHHNKDKWKCVIFWEFHNVKGSNGRPVALFKSNEYCDYKCAIPYSDQTKHLVGTTDTPDKHYKFVSK